MNLERYRTDFVAFCDDFVKVNELGQPFRLMNHQRQMFNLAFQFDKDGRLSWDTLIDSCPKKSGKTFKNGLVTTWWAFTQEAPNELYIVANDLEQSVGRVFKTTSGIIRNNPQLARSAQIQSRRLRLSNGTVIIALASDWAGSAGSNHGFVSWDEPWGIIHESSKRQWEELTGVPTRRNSIRYVTTYAGWENESKLLWDLYLLGVAKEEHPDGQGERIHPDLPIYTNREARLLVYWDHEPRLPWQTQEYYAAQKRTLRPGTYLRLHENRWAPSESVFITPGLWDSCVDPDHRPLLPSSSTRPQILIGADAGIKHDHAAVAGVYWDGERLALAFHRIWKPSKEKPLDLEQTMENYLIEAMASYNVQRIYCDPYQMHRSLTTLKRLGLPIEEFPQTSANTTRMGQVLFDLLNGRNIRLYQSAELRQHAMNAVAVETPRGFRLQKEKAATKIDAIVALAIGCVAAMEFRSTPLFFISQRGEARAALEEARQREERQSKSGLDFFSQSLRMRRTIV